MVINTMELVISHNSTQLVRRTSEEERFAPFESGTAVNLQNVIRLLNRSYFFTDIYCQDILQ